MAKRYARLQGNLAEGRIKSLFHYYFDFCFGSAVFVVVNFLVSKVLIFGIKSDNKDRKARHTSNR